MRRLILHIAISLDGKIARTNGDVDWLDAIPHEEGADYGFYEMYNNIDTTIQGNKTYQKVLSWDVPFPYKDKKNYVFTTDSKLQDNEDVQFVSGKSYRIRQRIETTRRKRYLVDRWRTSKRNAFK
jgi:dihydrofolate reductase